MFLNEMERDTGGDVKKREMRDSERSRGRNSGKQGREGVRRRQEEREEVEFE